MFIKKSTYTPTTKLILFVWNALVFCIRKTLECQLNTRWAAFPAYFETEFQQFMINGEFYDVTQFCLLDWLTGHMVLLRNAIMTRYRTMPGLASWAFQNIPVEDFSRLFQTVLQFRLWIVMNLYYNRIVIIFQLTNVTPAARGQTCFNIGNGFFLHIKSN